MGGQRAKRDDTPSTGDSPLSSPLPSVFINDSVQGTPATEMADANDMESSSRQLARCDGNADEDVLVVDGSRYTGSQTVWGLVGEGLSMVIAEILGRSLVIVPTR